MKIIKGMTIDIKGKPQLRKLYSLLQKGKRPETIIAYKAVTVGGRESPFISRANKRDGNGKKALPITYIIGSIQETFLDTNEFIDCSYGINIATFAWCKHYYPQCQYLRVEVIGDEIVIPLTYEFKVKGKFRTDKVKVLD